MVFDVISGWASDIFVSFSENVPETYKPFIVIGFSTIMIAIYAIFVWKFYRFLAKRDLLELNLRQYNRSNHPVLEKLFAVLFFLLEYIIILPLIVFLWFGVLALFILLLSRSSSVSQVLLVAASVVAAVRLVSYFSEDLARDLAKVFPFTMLAVFLVDPSSFVFANVIEGIREIPSLFNKY